MPTINPFKFLKRIIKNSEPTEENNKDTQTKEEEASATTKIILLGAQETGKSTLFKTIKHLYCNNYTQDELLAFKEVIYYNIVRSLIKLVEKARSNDDLFLNKELITKFRNMNEDDMLLSIKKYWINDFPEMIFTIFNEPCLQKLLIADNYQTFDFNINYFMKHFNRIKDENNYNPTFKDCLKSYIRTTGYLELNFTKNNKEYLFCDIGGNRGERKKWFLVEDEANILIFTVSLNDFYLKCYEDDKTNRLEESLWLFKEIFCNDSFLEGKKKILLFTKVDLFIEKIKQGTFINKYFDGFIGDKYNPEHVFEFILNLFKNKIIDSDNCDKNKQLEYHVVNLTDIKEAEEYFEYMLSENNSGHNPIISPLLFSCRIQSKLQNNLYCNTKNRDLVDLMIDFQ